MPVSVVTLSKHPEITRKLVESVLRHEAPPLEVIVIADGHSEKFPGATTFTRHDDRFIFSRNANYGINLAGSNDVILMNDDCQIVEKDTLARLTAWAQGSTTLGIGSPMIDGGVGNPAQMWGRKRQLWPAQWIEMEMSGRRADSLPICLVAAFLKRRMIAEIGPLDEKFVGYGFDDNDYSIRARRAGWKTSILGNIRVQHGAGGTDNTAGVTYSSSYAKRADYLSSQEVNARYFVSKYGSLKVLQQQAS